MKFKFEKGELIVKRITHEFTPRQIILWLEDVADTEGDNQIRACLAFLYAIEQGRITDPSYISTMVEDIYYDIFLDYRVMFESEHGEIEEEFQDLVYSDYEGMIELKTKQETF